MSNRVNYFIVVGVHRPSEAYRGIAGRQREERRENAGEKLTCSIPRIIETRDQGPMELLETRRSSLCCGCRYRGGGVKSGDVQIVGSGWSEVEWSEALA